MRARFHSRTPFHRMFVLLVAGLGSEDSYRARIVARRGCRTKADVRLIRPIKFLRIRTFSHCFVCSRAGKILKDEQTLAESGVKDKEFIVVMVTKVCS